jgi:hypothetical protein
MMTKENSHYRRSRPCGIRTKTATSLRDPCEQPVGSNDHLRKAKTSRTCRRVCRRLVQVQRHVKPGFVAAKLNKMER